MIGGHAYKTKQMWTQELNHSVTVQMHLQFKPFERDTLSLYIPFIQTFRFGIASPCRTRRATYQYALWSLRRTARSFPRPSTFPFYLASSATMVRICRFSWLLWHLLI